MKKTLLALTLVLSLVLSVAALSVSADPTPVTAMFEDFADYNAMRYGEGGGGNTTNKSTSGSRYDAGGGSTLYLNPVAAAYPAEQNGTSRTNLFALSATATAGVYSAEIWVCDRDAANLVAGNNWGLMLTFHSASMTDADLEWDWNDATKTPSAAMIVHHVSANPAPANPYDSYTGQKATFTKTETTVASNGGNLTYTKYTATITIPVDAAKVALWVYQPEGYTNGFATGQFWVDALSLTYTGAYQAPAGTTAPGATSGTTTAPDNGDVASIVALVAVIGTAGVAFAAKKKH